MWAIILSTNDPHPGLQGLPSPHKQGPNPANSFSGARGCPPLQPERVELSSQRARLSSFLLGSHPTRISSSCSAPGTWGTNTLLMAPVFEDSGRQSWSTWPHSGTLAHHLWHSLPCRDIQDCLPRFGSQGPSGSFLHSPAALLPRKQERKVQGRCLPPEGWALATSPPSPLPDFLARGCSPAGPSACPRGVLTPPRV